jgi:hypothetical protein
MWQPQGELNPIWRHWLMRLGFPLWLSIRAPGKGWALYLRLLTKLSPPLKLNRA